MSAMEGQAQFGPAAAMAVGPHCPGDVAWPGQRPSRFQPFSFICLALIVLAVPDSVT
jgi:hypothetical protein